MSLPSFGGEVRAGARVRTIAFHLPQFHPIAENDEWWGKGFTEWTNVAKARPLFWGHYQPHLPADLGFYDLRLPEVRMAQAQLARDHGIHGFCYYHYWFNGRRVLERPFEEVLGSGQPDFPFCLCWANENWTRVWDGGDRHVLLGQNYNHDDDRDHIRSLMPAFRDDRYIRVDGKPLFLVYRTELLPDARRTAAIWREECQRAGLGEIYLARVENFVRGVDPASIGFDAAIEFAPDNTSGSAPLFSGGLYRLLHALGLLPAILDSKRVVTYRSIAHAMSTRGEAPYTRFRCVTPMWDNTARRGSRASIYADSTPAVYEKWLRRVVDLTRCERDGDERIVFINAWNEWAEGCHLEPDQKWGRGYLEATRRALAAQDDAVAGAATDGTSAPGDGAGRSTALRRAFWSVAESLRRGSALLRQVQFRLGSALLARSSRP